MITMYEMHGLPFVEATITYRGQTERLSHILIDTGSAGTIFNVNGLQHIGVKPEPDDTVQVIYGVGGHEFVYTKSLDCISLGDAIMVNHFVIELGNMNYGVEMDGIIGYDFLKELGAIVDLDALRLR